MQPSAEGKVGVFRELIEEGQKYDYRAFADFRSGYPSSYKPAYLAWQTRVANAIRRAFADDSAPVRVLNSALQRPIFGNGPDVYDQCRSGLRKALELAVEILEDDRFGEQALDSAPEHIEDVPIPSNRVFIVHGHDEASKTSLELFLRDIGLKPIVLHREADEGQTIIEKFERHSDVGYAFILLTPDEVTYLAAEESRDDASRTKERRARPNVIFEFGFFVGRLGRARVCCLYRGDVTLPSDVSGLLYKKFDRSIEEVAYGILKELHAVGYEVKL